MLFRLFIGIESLINKALGLLKRHLKPAWGRKMASSFISSAAILAKNPQGTMVTVSYASFSAILNMACLVAIGYAFRLRERGRARGGVSRWRPSRSS